MKFTIEIPDERVADYVGRANVGYWTKDTSETKWNPKTLRLTIIEAEPDAGYTGIHEIGPRAFAAGLVAMATKYPRKFAELLADDGDMYTGDLLIQCACFGEEKYS